MKFRMYSLEVLEAKVNVEFIQKEEVTNFANLFPRVLVGGWFIFVELIL